MISILVGEPYQVSVQQQKLVADFLVANDELALERINPSVVEVTDIVMAVKSLPLLCDSKMVILGSLNDRKDMQGRVEEVLSVVADEIHLVLAETNLTKGSAYQKTLARQPGYFEYKPKSVADLQQWLVAYAQELGSKIDASTARFLIDQLGDNNLILATELRKMSVHAEIDKNLVSRLVEPVPRSRIFDLLDAITKGAHKQAIEFYEDQRLQKVEPLYILTMIIWQVQLILLAQRSKRSLEQVANEAGVGAYPLRKANEISKVISSGQLLELVRSCLATDQQIRLNFVNPDNALKLLITKACLTRS